MRTTAGMVRWQRELDETLSAWVDDDRVVLRRTDRGRVRLVLSDGGTRVILESSDANLTGDLVALWALAESNTDDHD